MKQRTDKLCSQFFKQHTELHGQFSNICAASEKLTQVYQKGNKVLVCGNGGSAADSDHIVGELMKGFVLKRSLPPAFQARICQAYPDVGLLLAQNLQGSLPAISLSVHNALISAFSNDVEAEMVYAQQVLGYTKEGDVLIGITTSGNAENICHAMRLAHVLGAETIALTGRDGGKVVAIADLSIIAPEQETYKIQELHLIIYHFICAYIESELFD